MQLSCFGSILLRINHFLQNCKTFLNSAKNPRNSRVRNAGHGAKHDSYTLDLEGWPVHVSCDTCSFDGNLVTTRDDRLTISPATTAEVGDCLHINLKDIGEFDCRVTSMDNLRLDIELLDIGENLPDLGRESLWANIFNL